MSRRVRQRRFTVEEYHRMGETGHGPPGGRERSVISRGQRLAPGAFPDLALTVGDLIG